LRGVSIWSDFPAGYPLFQGGNGCQTAGSRKPFVERFIGTLRREMLNHVIVLGQGHLEWLLREFIEDYYHIAKSHQGLDGDTPISQTKQPQILGPSKLISIPVLGGLHHRYIRVAA